MSTMRAVQVAGPGVGADRVEDAVDLVRGGAGVVEHVARQHAALGACGGQLGQIE